MKNWYKMILVLLYTQKMTTIKIEYLPLDKPRAAYILTLLVWHWELSFGANRLHFSRGQHKHLHCKLQSFLMFVVVLPLLDQPFDDKKTIPTNRQEIWIMTEHKNYTNLQIKKQSVIVLMPLFCNFFEFCAFRIIVYWII